MILLTVNWSNLVQFSTQLDAVSNVHGLTESSFVNPDAKNPPKVSISIKAEFVSTDNFKKSRGDNCLNVVTPMRTVLSGESNSFLQEAVGSFALVIDRLDIDDKRLECPLTADHQLRGRPVVQATYMYAGGLGRRRLRGVVDWPVGDAVVEPGRVALQHRHRLRNSNKKPRCR